MSCEDFRAALLGEEARRLGGELRTHARGCTECAALLDRIEADTERLEAGLAAFAEGMRESDAVELAMAGAKRDRKRASRASRAAWLPGFLVGERRGDGLAGRHRALRWFVPAAAAAGFALWVGTGVMDESSEAASGGTQTMAPDRPAVATAASMASEADALAPGGFSIDAPEEGRVAVFQTSNPKIRVVWFYDETQGQD